MISQYFHPQLITLGKTFTCERSVIVTLNHVSVMISTHFYPIGIVRLEKLCLLTGDEIAFLGDGHIPNSDEFQSSLTELKQHMVLRFWLKPSHLEEKSDKFVIAGFHSLERIVSSLKYSDLEDILEKDTSIAAILWERIKSLKKQSNLDFDSFPVEEPTSLGLYCAFALWRIAKLICK